MKDDTSKIKQFKVVKVIPQTIQRMSRFKSILNINKVNVHPNVLENSAILNDIREVILCFQNRLL